ncbi:hypothetical protein DERP_001865 [Dermatophagoides pteronyssinus]|uniref:Uncharacterized protein n=1 Tax=Dermatophagoides pteronyssinus TaxID=6956 RepID=A0ABQ8JBT6_DERPT|nr:hypothetical protein DERP_001865 [Dermatophagoides pteronyssinus]
MYQIIIDVELDDYDNDENEKENENNKSNIFNHGGRIEPGSMMTIDDDGQILQFSTTTTTIFPVKLKSNNQKKNIKSSGSCHFIDLKYDLNQIGYNI